MLLVCYIFVNTDREETVLHLQMMEVSGLSKQKPKKRHFQGQQSAIIMSYVPSTRREHVEEKEPSNYMSFRLAYLGAHQRQYPRLQVTIV